MTIIKINVLVELKPIEQLISDFGFHLLFPDDPYCCDEYISNYCGHDWFINRFMMVNIGKSMYLKKLRKNNINYPNYDMVHDDGKPMYYHSLWMVK